MEFYFDIKFIGRFSLTFLFMHAKYHFKVLIVQFNCFKCYNLNLMHKNNKIIVANALKINPYIEYFSKFKYQNKAPQKLSQFADALILLNLIQQIKEFTISGEIMDNPRTFSDYLHNLKILFKSIQNYWNLYLKMQLEIEQIDWIQIAKSGNEQQIQKMLQLFIKTTAQSQNKIFIQKILQTSQETQFFLKNIVQKIFHNHHQSPRKQKENRMFDKILELDHQNQKYQLIIREIENQKIQLEVQVKLLHEKLSQKDKQLQQINFLISDVSTPRKKQLNHGVPDTADRKEGLIQSLKKQISEMSIMHQKEVQALCHQIQRLTIKASQYDHLKNQLQLSREIIDSHREYRQQSERMQQQSSQIRADLMSKENHIQYLKQKLQKASKMIIQFQTKITMQKGQMERKNIKISQLMLKIQDIQKKYSPNKNQNHNILYLQFPQISNTETEAYIETNKYLREQLQRTRIKLQESDQQLSKCNEQLKGLRGCELQNKKLREMVIDLNTHRGQQNQILMSSLYHLRKMIHTRAF